MAFVQRGRPALSIGEAVGESFLVAGPPPVVGAVRDADVGTARTLALAAAIHASEDAVHHRAERGGLPQQKPSDVLADCAEAVVEIGSQGWLARCRWHFGLAVVGEQPGHLNQREADLQFLQHKALRVRVKGLQALQSIDDFVDPLLPAPAVATMPALGELAECLDADRQAAPSHRLLPFWQDSLRSGT